MSGNDKTLSILGPNKFCDFSANGILNEVLSVDLSPKKRKRKRTTIALSQLRWSQNGTCSCMVISSTNSVPRSSRGTIGTRLPRSHTQNKHRARQTQAQNTTQHKQQPHRRSVPPRADLQQRLRAYKYAGEDATDKQTTEGMRHGRQLHSNGGTGVVPAGTSPLASWLQARKPTGWLWRHL